MTGADPYRALAAGLPNGAIALFDSVLRHRLFDGAEARAIGVDAGMAGGSSPGAIFPAEVADEIERRYRETIAGQPQSFDVRLGESDYRVVTAPLAIDGEPHGIALFQNVTCERRRQEQVWREANFDDVTGLPNRRLTTDRLATALAQARRYDKLGALLFVDLDDFKGVNDVHGHDVGDAVLRTVAERLTGAVRRSDTVGRFAGDEFLIVVSEIAGEEDADVVAEKVLEVIAAPIGIAGEPVSVSASIGVALYPDAEAEADQMIVRADHAMYAAKASGRNTTRRAPRGWSTHRTSRPTLQK
ncbi:MAG: GGDEF domain-containing protein [Acetobacterales bacterium]